MEGISSLQGPHQVAQKLRKMILPFKALNWTFSPFNPSRQKSGVFFLSTIDWILIFERRLLSWLYAGRLRRRMRAMIRKGNFFPIALNNKQFQCHRDKVAVSF